MPHSDDMCLTIARFVIEFARNAGSDPVADGVHMNSIGGALQSVRRWNIVDGKKVPCSEVFRRHMPGWSIGGDGNSARVFLGDRSVLDRVRPRARAMTRKAAAERLMGFIMQAHREGDGRPTSMPFVGKFLSRGWKTWRRDTGYSTLGTAITNLLPGRVVMSDNLVEITAPDDPPPLMVPAPPEPAPAAPAEVQAGQPRVLSRLEDLPVLRHHISGARLAALDCEGVNLGPEPDSLTLVQLAFEDGAILLVDVFEEPGLLYALRKFLEDPVVTKVVHDCRMDAAAIKAAAGIALAGVFDTQVAYMSLDGAARRALPGLHAVLGRYAPEPDDHPDHEAAARRKAEMRDHMARSPAMWRERPLDEVALAYAADDVARLLDARQAMLDEGADETRVLELSASRCGCPAAPRPGAGQAGGVVLESGWLTFDPARRFRPVYEQDEAAAAASHDSNAAELARLAQAEMAAEWAAEHGDLNELVRVLPAAFQEFVMGALSPGDTLVDLVMDLGRPPHARVYTSDGTRKTVRMPPDTKITRSDIDAVCDELQFGNKNRAGIPGTLHRVSAMRDADGTVFGLTARVGRWFHGAEKMAPDLVLGRASLLVVGRPGAGKTTALRDIARLKAETESVVIVDTSSEIAGVGTVPHASIGHARRMVVPDVARQHDVMIEAVQNHTPDVVVIDEIGTAREANAARSVCQRGVQLIATAHGRVVADLVRSNDMNQLVGGKNTVVLSTVEAKARGCPQTQVERQSSSSFRVAIEMIGSEHWVVHHNVNRAIDAILGGRPYEVEVRRAVVVDGEPKLAFSIEMHTARPEDDDEPSDGSDDDGLSDGADNDLGNFF